MRPARRVGAGQPQRGGRVGHLEASTRELAALLGLAPPPFVALDTLSPMARGFYAENRRVATGKAKRVLGWTPAFPDYRAGLRALSATTSPMPVSTAPATASGDQR